MRILVQNLKFQAILGILDFERQIEQEILVNAKFEADEFIDYAEVCKEIELKFKGQKFLLIEDALKFFENFYKEKFQTLSYFYMQILKPKILPNAVVGVEFEKKF